MTTAATTGVNAVEAKPTFAGAAGYLATDIVVATVAFSAVVTGLALSAGLLVTFFLALPAAWATFWAARVFAGIERWRLWAFLGIEIDGPARPAADGWFAQLKADLRARSTWRQVGHALAQLPVACLSYAAVIVAIGVPIGLIATPFFAYSVPSHSLNFWVAEIGRGWVSFAIAVAGVVLLPAGGMLLRWAARFRARMNTALLTASATDTLEERVSELEVSRSRTVDAAEAERRRIERDLHDGAQQRLIALAMDLGMAREKLASDPASARELIDEAHDEAKRAIVELRDLARGIHPAVLTDRGLAAALESIAGRSPVPVALDVRLDERPPPAIEGIAYFVVSEALANVAKHGGATRATVTVTRRAANLLVEVNDDGAGGADLARGTGLAGLRDRVESVDGWFHLSSPVGGPTTLTVELPCES